MTAFYMFRLMSMTFLGGYRGPAWEGAAHGTHDPHAHGGAHSPARDAHGHGHGAAAAVPDHGHGHGHGAWHGPHESPRSMTLPLMALAVGSIVAGFIGLPAALVPGGNQLEHFLEPSFSAPSVAGEHAPAAAVPALPAAEGEHAAAAEEHHDVGTELAVMALSVLVAAAGIWFALRIYVRRPELSEQMARRWSGAHQLLSNKYYVDELYDATVIKGTMSGARNLWTFDSRVVDGGVNGAGWFTVFSSWISHLVDKYIVDGLVNLVGWTAAEGSLLFRRLQTGLIQNYALLMVFGLFAFLSVYLFTR
jgi:NADH-quinone oxidoreductase subunit L